MRAKLDKPKLCQFHTVCIMADDHTDSDVPITLLADDDEKQELSKAIITLNKNVAALTNSVQSMGESIAEIRQSISTATAKRDSRAVACSESKAKRQCKALPNEGSNAEIQAFLTILQTPKTELMTLVAKAPSNATNFLKPWQQNTCPKTRQAVLYLLSLPPS